MKRTPVALALAALCMIAASGLSAQTGNTGSATSGTAPSGRSGGNANAMGSTTTGAAVPGSTARDSSSRGRARNGTEATANAPPKLDRADRKFVEEAAGGGMKEVEFGRLAADKASDPAVKQFGERMVRDHSDANKKLMDVAQSKGVSAPPTLTSSDQRMLDKLAKMSGDKFDRAYMDDMVKDHKKDVKDFRKEAKSGKEAEVKKFAEDTLPLLEEHLKLAQDTQSKVKSGGGSAATRAGTAAGPGMASGTLNTPAARSSSIGGATSSKAPASK